MAKLSTKGNRFYPGIPEITDDLRSHTEALKQIKTALETHERRSKDFQKSFVRFEELVELGFITTDGTIIE